MRKAIMALILLAIILASQPGGLFGSPAATESSPTWSSAIPVGATFSSLSRQGCRPAGCPVRTTGLASRPPAQCSL